MSPIPPGVRRISTSVRRCVDVGASSRARKASASTVIPATSMAATLNSNSTKVGLLVRAKTLVSTAVAYPNKEASRLTIPGATPSMRKRPWPSESARRS